MKPEKTLEPVASVRVEEDPVETSAEKNKSMAITPIVEGPPLLSADIQRINERLNYAVDVVAITPTNQTRNRSPDLVPLTADYLQMKTDLKGLLEVLLGYQKCTRELQETRFKIAQKLAQFSEHTPLYNEIGRELDADATDNLHLLSQQHSLSPSSLPTEAFSPSVSTPKSSSSMSMFLQSMGLVKEDDSNPTLVSKISRDYCHRIGANVVSLYGIYSLGAAQAVGDDSEYQSRVIEYAKEWIDTVTGRVDEALKRVRKLATERLHYERKIQTLRDKATGLERKGKSSPSSAVERLSRNERKLQDAFVAHEKEAGKVCVLIETVTREGYKDVYILARNYIQWELNRIGGESDIAFQLNSTLNWMNKKFGSLIQTKWEPQ